MNVAVMGYGTIGSGVVEVLDINYDLIAKRVGQPLDVKYILDLRDFPEDKHAAQIVHDIDTILSDEDVQIVVETMGGTGAAYKFVKAALEAGKHVATSNKALVAKYGSELMQIAKDKQINFFYEAAVGGGIPIIRTLDSALTGDEVEEIFGILNGTTNYILTKMAQEGSAFDDVLKEAQELGYAELDPTDDIEGYDVGRKIAILTSIISGHTVQFEDVHIDGISKITKEDMQYADAMNRKIKLLAKSRKEGDSYCVQVAPYLLAPEHPLCTVNGAFNAVFLRSNALGDSMYYGSGAGKLPTASAVVGDIVDIVKNMDVSVSPKWDDEKLTLADYKKETGRFFVRIKGSAEQAQAVFGEGEVIDGVLDGEVGFITCALSEGEMEEKLSGLDSCISMIRLG